MKMKAQFQFDIILNIIAIILAEYAGQLAHQKCIQYTQFEYTSSNFLSNDGYGVAICENLMMPLIIGGSKVDRTEFPHMVVIGYGSFSKISYLCGGTLISERFVMTAAHCAESRRGPAKVVRLGSINLVTKDDHTHIVAIDKIIVHPGYRRRYKYDDIALIRMSRTIYFNEFIRPACLNINHNIKWSTAIATGFGVTATGNEAGSNDLLKVILSKVSMRLCRATFRPSVFLEHGVIESQFCAGDLTGNKDTCQGDSGGPLQILVARPHCVYSIIGITSFGRFCGYVNSPAIYTNVSHYIGWIEKHVWQI